MLSFLEQSIIFGNAIDSARNIISISENDSGSLVGRTTNSDGTDFSKKAEAAKDRDDSSNKIADRRVKNTEQHNINQQQNIAARNKRTAAINAKTEQDKREYFSGVKQANKSGSTTSLNSMVQ